MKEKIKQKLRLNKNGSAILWTLLLTVILLILLGGVMMSTFTYYSYTTKTVRKQQAYFTARSAVNLILNDLSRQDTDNSDFAAIMPTTGNPEVKINSFGFKYNMGDASAVLKYVDSENVKVVVTGTYQGFSQKIECTVTQQPVYFGGICLDTFNNGTTGTLILDSDTDLYYRGGANDGLDGRTLSAATLCNTQYLKSIGGNLVARGNISVAAGTKVAGHIFNKTTTFSDTSSALRQIWNTSEYVISNHTLQVDTDLDSTGDSFGSKLLNFLEGDYKFVYCNNNAAGAGDFGGLSNATILGLLSKFAGLLGGQNLSNDASAANLALKDFSTDKLGNRYLQIWSVSALANKYIQSSIWEDWLKTLINNYGLTYRDISYIDYSAQGYNTAMDKVTPIMYLMASEGTTIRMEWGYNPSDTELIGIVQGWFESIMKGQTAYTIVILGPNSTLELGANNANAQYGGKGMDFYMSIYGDSTSKVILDNGVHLYGSVNVGQLNVANGATATVSYSTTTGATTVGKQEVAKYWTVSNYSDMRE